jgi:hypothetical protein
LRMRFGLLIQQVGNVSPTAHGQGLGDPLQTYGRFLLGLLWPVFALANRSPHLPFFAWSCSSHMPRPLPRWLTEFF